MDLIVYPDPAAGRPHVAIARFGAHGFACAIGRSGTADSKHEGDGASPIGRWAMRRIYYRADRCSAPKTALPVQEMRRHDGWCDEPDDPKYNQPVDIPYPVSAESLWRDDGLYDLCVVLNFNMAPTMSGAGSAIFLHIARPDFGATEGCVALREQDLRHVLAQSSTDSGVCIRADPAPA